MVRVLLVSEGNRAHAEAVLALGLLPDAGQPISMAAAKSRYSLLIECADASLAVGLPAGDTRIALVVRDYGVLTALLAHAIPVTILFVPGRLAVLDATAASRVTLKAIGALDGGHRLTEDDIGLERNGPGLGIELQGHVLGRRLLYPLAAGAPIDFGMLA